MSWTADEIRKMIEKGKVKVKNSNGFDLPNNVQTSKVQAPSPRRPHQKPKIQDVCGKIEVVTPSKKLWIGVDPDKSKSGVAVWDSEKQDFLMLDVLQYYYLTKLFDSLIIHPDYQEYEKIFLIEYGKGNNAIFGNGDTTARGRKVGWNEQVGSLLCEHLEIIGANHRKIVPKKGRYAKFGVQKGKIKARKFQEITSKNYLRKIRGENLLTTPQHTLTKSPNNMLLNQEIRDAALMVYGLC